MSTLHTINGKAVEVKTDSGSETISLPPPPAAPAVKQTHKPECGEVGNVGQVGDLGSNAAE